MNPNSPAFSLVLMVLLIAMIYFMMIRPQRKKDKADREMREALKVGDEVITIGGIIGKVEKITDKTVTVSTTAGKNKIEFLKTAIATVSSKGASDSKPAEKEAPKAAEEEKAPSRDKKVTPKKLGKKSEDAE
jgi:preprotein translocase subunit YajC